MFQKKKEKQQKPKKLRVYTVNSRKPTVIVLWLLFVCGFVFAVYKNFTAIDTHTVHEKEIVERRVEDTSGVEAFVRNFAKTYYSWSNNKDSVAQRTDALIGYLTEDLQRLTADTVKSDVAVSSSVQNIQIWSVEQNGSENDFAVVFTVAQMISDGKKKTLYPACTKQPSTRTITEKWSLHKHRRLPASLQNLHIRQKPQNPTERFLRLRARSVPDFLHHLFYAVSDGDRKRAVLLRQRGFHAAGQVRGLYVQPGLKARC